MFKKCLLMVVCTLSLVGCGNKFSDDCKNAGLSGSECRKIVNEYSELGEDVVKAVIRGEGKLKQEKIEWYQILNERKQEGLDHIDSMR